jgi:cytochrome c oxidase accessory protein FixG
MSVLPAPNRVLPTLNNDGTRRWVRPRLSKGRFQRRRLVTAWTLMVLFAALPFVRVNGKPALLLDVQHGRFFLFGRTFLPTDGVLLMLLMLTILIVVIFGTALAGRVWCGWGCPQTVYLEFLFRPIERLFEGDHRAQAKLDREGANLRRVAKTLVFALLSAVVGNVFLSYFVGTDVLFTWMRHSPSEHPAGFGVMAVTTGLVFFDFAYFREQMCTIVCPYARLQSVLLDKRSLVVAYDSKRGEPRGKKGKVTGDCVDCALCVLTCPTGIDIRNGLQLECVGCTQCIDACDAVMTKVGRPLGLIRYTSQDALESRRFHVGKLLRPRLVVYGVVAVALVVALDLAAGTRREAEVSVLRGIGAPFIEQGELIQNHVRIKIQNRTNQTRSYFISLEGAGDATLIAPENPLSVAKEDQATESVFVLSPRAAFPAGVRAIRIRVTDREGFARVLPYQLLGPTFRPSGAP